MQRHRPESLGRYELVAVGECGPGHAAPSEVSVNYGLQSAAAKNVEDGEKSPERVDVVRFKLYLRHVSVHLYG
mgnify:CR=1 FL=1